jgi:hypothetical protein
MDNMSALEERLTLLEEKVGKPAPIEQRLAKVEASFAQPKRKDPWEKAQVVLGALSPLLTGLALAFVGYLLNGTINKALEERKIELGNVTQMRDLLVHMRSADTAEGSEKRPSQAEMDADAMALAAFGPYSVPPLIQLLQTGGDVSAQAAEKGLRSLLLTYPAETCEQFGRVLANRSQSFSWQVHLHILRLAGSLDCREQVGILKSYDSLLPASNDRAGLKRYQDSVDPAADFDSVDQLKAELGRALAILERQEAPRGRT